RTCEVCNGARLKPEALAVKIAGNSISEAAALSIAGAVGWFAGVDATLSPSQREIAERILKEINERLGFLKNVGLEYLTLMRASGSITGQYLTGMRQIPVPDRRRSGHPGQILKLIGARGNNLKDITAEVPLGTFCCVTGVSGGGKSTLIVETLYKALAKRLNNARETAAPFAALEGDEFLDKIVDIDQSPIGRTPRSNP